jgi:hypothetical protein
MLVAVFPQEGKTWGLQQMRAAGTKLLLLNYLLVLKVGPTDFRVFFMAREKNSNIYIRMLYSALSNTGA